MDALTLLLHDAFGIPLQPTTKLSPEDEADFQKWFQTIAQTYHQAPADDPRHNYDWRAMWQSGVRAPNAQAHWPSQFKTAGHPNRFVGGMDTITGATGFPPNMSPDLAQFFQLLMSR